MIHTANSHFTLGVCGDGQLSRLTAIKAREYGISILIYTLDAKSSPCLGEFALWEGKSWNDVRALERFALLCDIIILENEFIPTAFLDWVEAQGKRVIPNPKALGLIDNKAKQIEIAKNCGIKTPKTVLITETNLDHELHPPLMLKSLTGGYDGYGNFTFQDISQKSEAISFIKKHGVVLAQEYIQFDMEVAIMIARDRDGVITFPIVETIQENNICHYVITPPQLPPEVLEQIENHASNLVKEINGLGLFGIEFFIRSGEVIFNEIAPRPHNSGHFSIEACDYSQFDAIIKMALEIPLTPNYLKYPVAGMLNLLGNRIGKASFEADPKFFDNSIGSLHLYGKKESKLGRKMGHFTMYGAKRSTLLSELRELKQRYQT